MGKGLVKQMNKNTECKVGDRVKVYGLNKIGTVKEIEIYEDDDGYDEEYGQIIRKITYYKVKFEDGSEIEVKYNLELVEE